MDISCEMKMQNEMAERTYQQLTEKLRAAYRKMQVQDAISGFSKFMVVVLASLISVAALESIGKFSSVGRFLLLVVLGVVSLGGVLVVFLYYRYCKNNLILMR